MKLELAKMIRPLVCAALLFGGVSFSANAQNNPHRINDRLYPLYIKAYNNRKSASCLAVADSLRRASIAIGDHWGECYALSIPFLYEFYRPDNLKALESAMRPFMEKSKEYGLTTLYNYAISMKVAYFARESRYIEAFLYLKEQTALAERQGNMEGVMTLYRMQGVIQHFRGELPQAIYSYEQAIAGYLRNNYRRFISREYLSIADCYRMMCNYEKVLETANTAMPYCVTRNDSNNVRIYQCYSSFMLGRFDEFTKNYKYLETHKTKLNNSYIIMNRAIKACKEIYDGDDAAAMREIDAVADVSPEESYRLRVAYYKYKNDYAKAIEYMRKIMFAHNDNDEHILHIDKESMERIFRDQHLKSERQNLVNSNTLLKLSNAQMSLHNSSLELGRRRDAVKLAEIQANRNFLSSSHQRLVARQLSDSIAMQQIIQKSKERRMKFEHYVLMLVLGMAVLALLMTLAYSLRKRKLAQRLSDANAKLSDSIRQLNEAMDKAQESDRMKTLFIQNMSHEIRTPLNAIVGFSRLVSSGGSDIGHDEKQKMARYISNNSDLLTTLVNDILDITELQSGKFSLNKEPVAVNGMCRETIETVRHRLAEGVEMTFESEFPDSFTIDTDPHRVRQVLINLLTNAEKNTTQGHITLSCSRGMRDGMLKFSVTDTGIGVPPERQKVIFERYHKLDSLKQGAGLGLDICRTIVSNMGGEINIDPEYTSGARFWFTINVDQ